MPNLTIRRPDDMHLHLRQGEMLKTVLPATAASCARAIIMPNTTPPILTAADVKRYREEIRQALPANLAFEPLMTFKIVASTTPELVKDLKKAGAVAGKLYPEGVTTNSEDGVRDIPALYPVFAQMQAEGLVLCLHGEQPGVFSLDREAAFLPLVEIIINKFPDLKVVLEHITTKKAADLVEKNAKNLAATITTHHLRLTLDDVVGDKIQPHHFCKPIAKRPEDRAALLHAATSGKPCFFSGTDSAPHSKETKECAAGCAGVYTAPVNIPILAEIFEEQDCLEKLEDFVSRFGAEFYGLPLNPGELILEKKDWEVPQHYGSVIPFMAGKILKWQLQ